MPMPPEVADHDQMPDLLWEAIAAHGGMARWRAVRRIEVKLSVSGALWTIKGFRRACAM
jgi:hypothetical protein